MSGEGFCDMLHFVCFFVHLADKTAYRSPHPPHRFYVNPERGKERKEKKVAGTGMSKRAQERLIVMVVRRKKGFVVVP